MGNWVEFEKKKSVKVCGFNVPWCVWNQTCFFGQMCSLFSG